MSISGLSFATSAEAVSDAAIQAVLLQKPYTTVASETSETPVLKELLFFPELIQGVQH